jgi:hypothetical protein
MGIWGPGIFDNDIACDIRDAFEDELSTGVDVPTATQRVTKKFSPQDDEIDGPDIYLALAALQLEQDALETAIKDKALLIIASDRDWGESVEFDPSYWLERRQVLDRLRTQLIQSDA